ncbi:MAG: site-specific integrase [Pseudomonas sp.]|nr:site-specific integrase [Pseudomonas sp.]
MKVQLTKRLIENAKPRAKPYELRDVQTKGLLLRVQPSGHKAYICEWVRGKRRTLGASAALTLDDARLHATKIVAEYVQNGLPAIGKPKVTACTLRDFLDGRYAPWAMTALKSGKGAVERIRAAFAQSLDVQLLAIDAGFIDRWSAARLAATNRLGKRVGKVTVGRDLASLRSAMTKAVEWKLLSTNALLDIKQKGAEARKVVRYLTTDEESRIREQLASRDARLAKGRASANQWRVERNREVLPVLSVDGYADHLTPLVLLAINTGLRRGELLSLRWADVDLDGKLLTVRAEQAKSGRQRHVPLNAEAHAVLHSWKQQGNGDAQIFQPVDVKTAWNSLMRKAGVADFRFHDLRHTFASKLVTKGVDLNTVRELLGHGDIKMTLRYAHLAPAHIAAAVARLSDN